MKSFFIINFKWSISRSMKMKVMDLRWSNSTLTWNCWHNEGQGSEDNNPTKSTRKKTSTAESNSTKTRKINVNLNEFHDRTALRGVGWRNKTRAHKKTRNSLPKTEVITNQMKRQLRFRSTRNNFLCGTRSNCNRLFKCKSTRSSWFNTNSKQFRKFWLLNSMLRNKRWKSSTKCKCSKTSLTDIDGC